MSLSHRAQDAAIPSGGTLIWEVLQDLWHPQRNPNGFVSLGVAENSLMHDVLSKHIHKNLSLTNEAFTYGDGPRGSKRLKLAMANFLTKHLKPVVPIKPEHIVATNGCTTAIEHLSWMLANPGECFLLGQPHYGAFIPDISFRTGVEVVQVPFHNVDPLGPDAVGKYEAAILQAQKSGKRISGLMLCHPHNPLGRCYSRNVLIGLMRLCEKYQIHLVSDEIYALSLWPNKVDENPPSVAFESLLSIDPAGIIDPSRLHVIWGMSKDFGANGLRVGAIISQHNPTLHAALIPAALYTSVSSMAENATANILEDTAWVEEYLSENRRRLAKQFEMAVKWAKNNDIDYTPGVNAAFFLWVNLGKAYRQRNPSEAVEDIDDHVMQALIRQKIFLASGVQFGSEQPGWFRIVFSNQADVLQEGLRRIVKALNGDKQASSDFKARM